MGFEMPTNCVPAHAKSFTVKPLHENSLVKANALLLCLPTFIKYPQLYPCMKTCAILFEGNEL